MAKKKYKQQPKQPNKDDLENTAKQTASPVIHLQNEPKIIEKTYND